MKIAIFGGSFDPPHLGHLQIASSLVEHRLVDEVWFVPVGSHAFSKNLTAIADRLKMLELLIVAGSHKNHFKINDYEVKLATTSITYNTMKHFSQIFPEHEFCFVMGSDQLSNFHKWHDYQKLTAEFSVLVYPRCQDEKCDFSEYQRIAKQLNLTFLEGFPVVMTSSTDARNFGSEIKLSKMVSLEVARYIVVNQLYRV
ncbi:MAG: nicotinate (nicotinamide) nucleotide adenylyltransferase [Pseudomonadales bacterium]|jgi:nicotinate-nucleotide adenylyltransferase|nr:nicotinate (nicotinamide) nucleotide adenylyltransferase [Pseudomonadales bacterium]